MERVALISLAVRHSIQTGLYCILSLRAYSNSIVNLKAFDAKTMMERLKLLITNALLDILEKQAAL